MMTVRGPAGLTSRLALSLLVGRRGVSAAGRDQSDIWLTVLIDAHEEDVGDSRSARNPVRSASRIG